MADHAGMDYHDLLPGSMCLYAPKGINDRFSSLPDETALVLSMISDGIYLILLKRGGEPEPVIEQARRHWLTKIGMAVLTSV